MNKRGISINQVPSIAFVFLLTGVFFAVGIIILSSLQSNQAVSTDVALEAFTVPAVNGTFSLSHYRLTSIYNISNSTGGLLGSANYTITDTYSSTVMYLYNSTPCIVGDTCYVTYAYDTYDAGVPLVIGKEITALTEIPANWLLLIAVIVAAAVVIGIVMSSLGRSEGRA